LVKVISEKSAKQAKKLVQATRAGQPDPKTIVEMTKWLEATKREAKQAKESKELLNARAAFQKQSQSINQSMRGRSATFRPRNP